MCFECQFLVCLEQKRQNKRKPGLTLQMSKLVFPSLFPILFSFSPSSYIGAAFEFTHKKIAFQWWKAEGEFGIHFEK